MLEQIKQIKLPSNVEMNNMTLEGLKHWRDKLKPFYPYANEFKKLDYPSSIKANRYAAFDLMVRNIEQGLARWKDISNYENETF